MALPVVHRAMLCAVSIVGQRIEEAKSKLDVDSLSLYQVCPYLLPPQGMPGSAFWHQASTPHYAWNPELRTHITVLACRLDVGAVATVSDVVLRGGVS